MISSLQAVTARTHFRGNVGFNGPRAGINLNDGFGGGDLLEHNLLFNWVRESGDHGNFNSWDRVPYITNIGESCRNETKKTKKKQKDGGRKKRRKKVCTKLFVILFCFFNLSSCPRFHFLSLLLLF